MFKRFQVADLFHNKEQYEPSEWVEIDDKDSKSFPDKHGVVLLKLSDGSTKWSYFYPDACAQLLNTLQAWNIAYKHLTPSYFWCCKDKLPIHDYTHWGKR